MRLSLLFSIVIMLVVSGCSSKFEQGKAPTQPSPQSGSRLTTSAPMVHTTSSNFSKIVVIRLKNGADLLEGLEKAVKQHNIKNAVILSGIGSLTAYHIHVVDSTTLPAKEVFPKANVPQDLLNVNGYIIDGRVHAHITFSDEEKALGGHLEPGTNVLTFAIITLGVLEEGADLSRVDDWKW